MGPNCPFSTLQRKQNRGPFPPTSPQLKATRLGRNCEVPTKGLTFYECVQRDWQPDGDLGRGYEYLPSCEAVPCATSPQFRWLFWSMWRKKRHLRTSWWVVPVKGFELDLETNMTYECLFKWIPVGCRGCFLEYPCTLPTWNAEAPSKGHVILKGFAQVPRILDHGYGEI